MAFSFDATAAGIVYFHFLDSEGSTLPGYDASHYTRDVAAGHNDMTEVIPSVDGLAVTDIVAVYFADEPDGIFGRWSQEFRLPRAADDGWLNNVEVRRISDEQISVSFDSTVEDGALSWYWHNALTLPSGYSLPITTGHNYWVMEFHVLDAGAPFEEFPSIILTFQDDIEPGDSTGAAGAYAMTIGQYAIPTVPDPDPMITWSADGFTLNTTVPTGESIHVSMDSFTGAVFADTAPPTVTSVSGMVHANPIPVIVSDEDGHAVTIPVNASAEHDADYVSTTATFDLNFLGEADVVVTVGTSSFTHTFLGTKSIVPDPLVPSIPDSSVSKGGLAGAVTGGGARLADGTDSYTVSPRPTVTA